MPYNIEFQISGLVITTIIALLTFSKRRENSPQGHIFRLIIISIFVELAMDIASVITISKRADIPEINDVFAYGYLLSMIVYIALMIVYGIFTGYNQDMSKVRKAFFYAECGILYAATIFAIFIIFTHELKYAGTGRYVYSYGIPSDAVYKYSTFAVIFLLLITISNLRVVPLKRQVPITVFCIMEGIVAIMQMLNKEMLIIGFGTSVTLLIMYLVLENPDLKVISYLTELNQKSRDLVMNVIPSSNFSSRYGLKTNIITVQNISILYLQIANSTELTLQMGEEKHISSVISFFEALDTTLEGYQLTKMKTTGTTYMVIGGYPEHTEGIYEEILQFAIAAERTAKEFNKIHNTDLILKTGINIGNSVIRTTNPGNIIFDIWGEEVYKTMMIESAAPERKICVTDQLYEKLSNKYKFIMGENIMISEAKVQTWILDI